MNHVYRIVFNRALGLVQVASELASGRGAGGVAVRRPRPGRRSVLAIALVLASGGALGQVAPGQLPTGAIVVGGAGGPTLAGDVMTINQTADRALIRWDTFDIGTGATVVFDQLSHQIALNQIVGDQPSQIMGDLTAGGTIFLINPNGILFGAGSTVSVGSLVASTLAPDDAEAFIELDAGDYANSEFQWNAGATGALVRNEGAIIADGGRVVLLGADAANAGTITVGTGEAALVAAGSAQIQLLPGGLQAVVPVAPVTDAPVGAIGIDNTGTISALGGTIVLRGVYADGLASSAVNSSGSLVATGIGGDPDGSITVESSGSVAAGGTIDAGAGQVDLQSSGDLDLSASVTSGTFNATAATIGLSGDVVTSGNQQYNGALNLGSNVALEAGGNVAFDSTLDGAYRLSVEAEGAFSFGGAVGGGTALAALAVDAGSFSAPSTIDVVGGLSLTVQTGGIAQSGAFTIGGDASFDAGTGNISLTNANNDFTGEVSLAGGAVSINDVGALQLGTLATDSLSVTSHGALDLGSGTVGGSLQANSSGAGIIQSGALSVSGTSILDAGGGMITLDGANDFGGAVSLTGGAVSINDDNALTLGTLDVGSLTAVSDGLLNLGTGSVVGALVAESGGAITQAGPLEVGGTSSLTAGGDITLGNVNNFFEGAVALDGGAASIFNSGALFLGAVDVASLAADADLIVLQDDVTSSGSQSYAAAVVLGDDVALTAGSSVTFDSTIDGAQQLSIAAGGHVGITGAVDVGSLSIDAGSFGAGAGMTVSGNLSVAVDAGGIGQSGAFEVGGQSSFDAGTGNIGLAHAGNDFTGAVSLSGGAVSINDVGALQLGTLATGSLIATSHGLLGLGSGTVAGNLQANSNGAQIIQSGALSVAGTSVLNAGSASIILEEANNDFGGAVSLTGGDVSIHDQGALTLGTLAVAGSLTASSGGALDLGQGTVAGTLSADSGDAITQSGQILAGNTSLVAGGDITLTSAANIFGLLTLSGGATRVHTGTVLRLGAVDVDSLVAQGPVILVEANITTTGDQSYAGPVYTLLGHYTLDAGGDVSFGSTLDSSQELTIRADGHVGFAGAVSANALTVDAGSFSAGAGMAVSGDLSVTAATGGIAQSGAFTVAGDASFHAVTGNITLTNVGNDFTGAVDLHGGAVAITDVNTLTLGQVTAESLHATAATIGLSDDVTTSGDQQYDGALDLDADLALTSGGDVGFGSTIDGAHGLSVDADGAVSFAGAVGGGTALAGLVVDAGSFSAASTIDVGGDLSIAVQTGNITQSGAFAVGGDARFDAVAGNITLTNVGNDFTGAVDLHGDAVAITDVNTLTLGQVTAESLHATAATIGLSGDVTTSGNQQYDGALELDADLALTSGGDVGFGSTIDGAHRLSVDADGAVAFGGAIGAGTALAALHVDAGSFSAASTIDVGDLSIAVQTGGIAQSGAFRVGGSASFDAGTGNISLSNAGNDFTDAVDLRGGAVAITDANALTLGQVDATSLHATAATIGLSGDVTTSGDQQYDGILGLATDLALTSGGNVGFGSTIDGAHRLSVDADGAVAFGGAVGAGTALAALHVDASSFSAASTIAVGGDLSIAVQAGGIAQSGAFTVDGSASFDAGTGNISLSNAGNDFTGTVDLRGGDAAIRDSNALTLGALAVDTLSANSRDALGLGQGVVGGTLFASSQGGGITQSGALRVGGASAIDAGGGAITLTDAGNDFVGAVSLTGGVATIRDGNALVLGTLDVEALSASSLGALGLGSGTIAGELVADSQGGAITQSGALRVDGASTIDAGAGAITLANGGNDFAGTVSLAGGAVSIRDVNALALGTLDVGALSAGSNGALDLGAGSIAGALVASSHGGAITQSGALQVAGASTIDAGSGAITLGHAGNDFVGAVALTGGAATIRDSNALVLSTLDVDALSASSRGALGLGSGTVAGDLIADSHGGAITQSGALHIGGASTIDAGAGAITLADAGNDFVGAVSLSGAAASIRDRDALSLATLDVDALTATSQGALGLGSGSIAGALAADSGGGAITQSGALTVGGPATLDAERGSITLASAGNDFAGEVSLRGGAVSINDANALTLGALDIGSLAASSHGALDLGAGTVAGHLTASSNGGAITQSGALRVDGSSALDAGTGTIGLANAGNDFVGEVALTGGAVSIHDRNTLTLGAVDATSLHAAATAIVLRQDIATAGDQVYDGALALANDLALDAGGNVAFGSTVGGAHALSVDADGHVGFAGAVAVGALAVDAGSFSAASTLDVAGNLSLAVQSGGIAQVGAFRVGGTADFDAGDGDILLTHADNDFGGAVSLTGGAVAIRDRNDLTLSHLRSGPDTDVHVSAGGALTLPAEAIDAGSGDLHLAADGGALTTRARLAGGNVNLLGAGGIALGHDVDAAGTLQLDSGGTITQSGGRISASVLTGDAGGSATLTGANRIGELGAFSASGIELANAGALAIIGPVDARSGGLLLGLSEGDLAIDGRVSAADIRLEVAGGIAQGADGQLVARTLSGHAGGEVNLGDATRFVDNQIERIGDFTARSGFSMTNGRSLTLASLNGSNFTIDAGTADFYINVDGDLRQDGTDWLYNGRGTWVASGGIGLPASPIYVTGLESQTATLGAPPAYFYAVRPDGSLLPILGDAVNVPTSVWAGRAQTSSNRQVAYVDVGADASNYRGYGLVEPGVRLPADQQPECDPDFPSPECEALQ